MFGLMTKRQYMSELTEARESYRWERDEALAKSAASESKYHRLLDALFPRSSVIKNHFTEPRRQSVVIEIDERAFRTPFGQADWNYIAKKIVRDLQGLQRDHRPDMREVMPEGIGGPEITARVSLSHASVTH